MSDPDLHSLSETALSIIQSSFYRNGCLLLVASGILLGILALIAYFKFSQIVRGVKRMEARVMSIAISNAVEQFYEGVNRLPLPSGPHLPGGDRDTDTSPAHAFTAVLMGKEGETAGRQNECNVDYSEYIKPAKKQKETAWNHANGVITPAAGGSYGIVDAYGNPYRIRLDTNGDQQLANPNPDQAAHGTAALAKRVIVWSAGKDGDWNTWDDNPMSWD